MGHSQSTRSRTPSYRIDHSMGRSKNEDSGAFQPTQTKDAPSLDDSAGEGFSVPPKHGEQPSIPIVTVTDASPDDKVESHLRYLQRHDSNYLDIAQEASEVFGLGESPVLFTRRPPSTSAEPDLPQPTNLLKPPRSNRTRASSIDLERKTDLQDENSTSPENISGGFKATESHKVEKTVPCVFKWTPKSAAQVVKLHTKHSTVPKKDNDMEPCDETGKMYKRRPILRRPKQVFLSGDFNSWQLIPMSDTSSSCFVTIIELPLGNHEYKFVVDGNWTHDPTQPSIDDGLGLGGKNNLIEVNATDRDAFDALDVDMKCLSRSPTDGYSQDVPHPNPPVSARGRQKQCPPVLPPHLLQVILNKETPLVCEPTLLPTPNHVMVNHMYALSFKDNVIVLSETSRYRKKYATTVYYKPTTT